MLDSHGTQLPLAPLMGRERGMNPDLFLTRHRTEPPTTPPADTYQEHPIDPGWYSVSDISDTSVAICGDGSVAVILSSRHLGGMQPGPEGGIGRPLPDGTYPLITEGPSRRTSLMYVLTPTRSVVEGGLAREFVPCKRGAPMSESHDLFP